MCVDIHIYVNISNSFLCQAVYFGKHALFFCSPRSFINNNGLPFFSKTELQIEVPCVCFAGQELKLPPKSLKEKTINGR